jgi:proton-translocating NADH-quinone oxidoreductase chain L
MYLLIVLLPLIGSLCAGFFGRFLGFFGSTVITTSCIFFTFLMSCVSFYEVALSQSIVCIQLFDWINCGMMDFSWGFLFDTLTVLMLCVVTCVSTIVHLYSIGYMENDPHVPRFFSYLSLFTFFMIVLVTADNLIQMFVGWEGVGLCSYLLINFWHTRLQANKAAIKAVIVNRVGDMGLVIGVLGIFYTFKTVNYSTLFALVPYFVSELNTSIPVLSWNLDPMTFICIFLFIGSVGKSAQIGLHTWLPDAMEGPTPVSALIHAATMVTAGVFLLARCSPLFEYSESALLVVTCMGAMTAFFAACTALVQNDLKRVIAYSTCSQLGYMVFACGISNYNVGVFHLANHAFFKALLFLSAGSVIHALGDEQDMRKMGGLVKLIPFTYAMMMIGSLSLMGFPFLTGFYSKDAILELSYGTFTISGHFAH